MKHIVLVTESEDVSTFFRPLGRSRKYSFQIMSYKEWRSCDEAAFCYLDVKTLKKKQLEAEIRSLEKRELPWGIVDPEGKIDDVASFFHRGAGDFIDLRRDLCFKVERVGRALDFFEKYMGDGDSPSGSGKSTGSTKSTDSAKQTGSAKLSGSGKSRGRAETTGKAKTVGKPETAGPAGNAGPQAPPAPKKIHIKKLAPPSISWDRVKENSEYSFCFLFVELLPSGEWKGKSGASHQEQMQTAFQDAVTRRVEDFDGKIWMWNEWTGLVLFPFDGKKCDAIVPGIRLLLNRVLLSIEGGDFQTVLNYKLALHVGSTRYRRRGQTGTIVSDDVNFIFHLGVKKADANSLYLSESAYFRISERLYPLFQEKGVFEGHQVYRAGSPFPGLS